MTRLNIRTFIIEQSQESYRACILHAPAMAGKSEFANRIWEELHDEIGIKVLDLQSLFLNDQQLSNEIGSFTPGHLQDLLLKVTCDEQVILVDNVDFLFNTWNDAEREQFFRIVKDRIRSPADTDKTILFFLQEDHLIANTVINNTRGKSRILPLTGFEAL